MEQPDLNCGASHAIDGLMTVCPWSRKGESMRVLCLILFARLTGAASYSSGFFKCEGM